MKRTIAVSVILVVSVIFSLVEAKAQSIQFPHWVLLLESWLHPLLFLPLLSIFSKNLKIWFKNNKKQIIAPLILSVFSVFVLIIQVRNQYSFISTFENKILICSNRIVLLLILVNIKVFIFNLLGAWDKIAKIQKAVLGEYKAPRWVSVFPQSFKYLNRNRKMTLSALAVYLVLFGLGYGLVHWQPRTKVISDASQRSDRLERGQKPAKTKYIEAYYYYPKTPYFKLVDNKPFAEKQSFTVTFEENPYDLSKDENIEKNFTFIPAIEGSWKKESERAYSFTPKQHWPAGESYQFLIDEKNFRKNISVMNLNHKFKIPKADIWISSEKFYVNPKDSDEKKAVIALGSNYPLSLDSVKENIDIELLDRKGRILSSMRFDVFHDEYLKMFYIHSENIKLTSNPQKVRIKVEKGILTDFSAKPVDKAVTKTLQIPSKYSFLNIDISEMKVRKNEDDEYYHSIKVDANTRLSEEQLKKYFKISKIKVYYTQAEYNEIIGIFGEYASRCFNTYSKKGMLTLDLNCSLTENGNWTYDDRMVLEEVVPYRFREGKIIDQTRHEMIVEPEVGASYRIVLKKGFKSIDGFELEFDKVVYSVPSGYPKILKFANEGSILSLNGSKKISIYARGEKRAKVKIKQIKAHQLQHFLSMSSAGKKQPYFNNYYFKEDKITDEYEDVIYFSENQKKGDYSEFDFSKFLNNRTEGKLDYGIFFVELEDSSGSEKDSQLFILSDMAYLTKISAAGEKQFFVVSQSRRSPLSGVLVKQMSMNGNTKTLGRTDDEGRFDVPEIDLKDKVVGYILENGQDTMYITPNNNDQRVDYSRFEIAGEYGIEKKLRVSIFSDRKLYRPGETGHLAFIFKDPNWSQIHEGELVNIEVRDARGKLFITMDQKIGNFGLNTLDFNLPYSAATGSYEVTVYSYHTNKTLKGESTYKKRLGSHSIKVQEFTPDKMKIAASFNKGNQKLWIQPKELKAYVSLRNLFGTPAVGNEVRANLILNPSSINLYKFPSYRFVDEKVLDKSVSEDLESLETNEQGKIEYDIDLNKYSENSFRLTFRAEGFMKAGGRSVVTEKSIMVSPHDYLIGFKAKGNLRYVSAKSNSVVNLIAVGPDHETKEAEVELVIFEKKYQNSLVKQADHTYAYQDIKEPIVYKREKIKISNSGLNYVLDNKRVGEFIVKIQNSAGEVLNSFEYNVVGDADLARSLYRSNELKLTLNNDDYAAGDTIKVAIKAPYTGVGVITIEKDRVYAAKWFKLDRETGEVSIKVPKDLAGNGYVNVSLLRSLDSKKVFTSPFSYAVVPFTLDKSKMVHEIEVTSEKLVKPGEDVHVKFRAKRAGKIIVYAVDKGIHQLANYVTPRPLDEFYKKQALSVLTYQIFSLIIPDIETLKDVFAPGGGESDMMSKNLNPFKRKFTKAVAFWSGVLDADTKWKEFSFKVPYHFNGELVLHSVFVDKQSVGVIKSNVISRDDLIISPTVPSFVAPGDEFLLSVAVSNNIDEQDGKKSDSVEIELKPNKSFKVIGDSKKSISINRAQDEIVTFKLKAQNILGNADLAILASSGSISSRYEQGVSIRPLFPRINRSWQTMVLDGNYQVKVGDVELYPEHLKFDVGLYPSLFGLIQGSLNYLAEYPYGCSEQVTSKAIAYAILPGNILGKSEDKRDRFLKQTNSILLQRQIRDGAIALYDGYDHPASDYINLYIAHFLTLSRKNGYYYNTSLYERLMKYVQSLTENGAYGIQAYALYLLALNEQQIGAQVKLLEGKLEKSDDTYAKLYLAAIYHILKNDKKALNYIEQVEKDRSKNKFNGYNYQLRSSFDRVYLGILTSYFPEKLGELSGKVFKTILDTSRVYGMNSFYAGLTLLSFGDQSSSQVTDAKIKLDMGKDQKELKISQVTKLDTKEIQKIKMLELDTEKRMSAFLIINQSGFPKKMKHYSNGLQIKKQYQDGNGNKVTQVKNGEEVWVELSVQSDEDIDDLVIVDLIPGGFDLVWKNDSADGISLDTKYIDQREDRVVIYASSKTSVEKFKYKIKAISPGKFQTPPSYGENMYKTIESTLSKTDEIEIIQ